MCAKVVMPFMGVSASGTIGKTLTASNWKGISLMRVWFKPSNPRTDKQVHVRGAMTLLVNYWKTVTPTDKELWKALASGKPLTGMNVFMRAGMNAYVLDPGVEVTPTNCSYTGTPGAESWSWNVV